jgi:acetyl esterase
LRTRIVSEPQFAGETAALLDGAEPGPGITDEDSLRAARDEPSDPELSLQCDPQVRSADLYLPVRGGPVLVRLYRSFAASGPGPLLLWLHGGGFIGGSVTDLDYPCSRLALLAGLTVVSLEYRLAPEHPW